MIDVGICVSICIGISICVGICIGISVCISVCVGVCVGICVCIGICVCVSVCVCISVCIGVCISIGISICIGIAIAIAVKVDPQSEDVAAYGDTIDTAYAAVDFLMVIVQNGGSTGVAVEDNSTLDGELQHTIAVNIMVGGDIYGNTCGNADVAETLNEVCLGQHLIVVRCRKVRPESDLNVIGQEHVVLNEKIPVGAALEVVAFLGSKVIVDGVIAIDYAVDDIGDRTAGDSVLCTFDNIGKLVLLNCGESSLNGGSEVGQSHILRILNDFDIDGHEVGVNFIGKFNVSNLLAVYGAAVMLGKKPEDVLVVMSTLHSVNGRLDPIQTPGGFTAVIDYAHTPDALENVLNAIHEVLNGKGQVITVCGAGGNRDKGKRPLMAQEAVKQSDKVIITSDNPRFEEPQDIINDMLAGLNAQQMKKVISIVDRREAIRTACMMAQKGDVVLIAGKGHENYQDVKGVKHHFDDHEVVREVCS